MSVSKGIFMCLLLGVIKIADMNVSAKIWFPGQQIKPLGTSPTTTTTTTTTSTVDTQENNVEIQPKLGLLADEIGKLQL